MGSGALAVRALSTLVWDMFFLQVFVCGMGQGPVWQLAIRLAGGPEWALPPLPRMALWWVSSVGLPDCLLLWGRVPAFRSPRRWDRGLLVRPLFLSRNIDRGGVSRLVRLAVPRGVVG